MKKRGDEMKQYEDEEMKGVQRCIKPYLQRTKSGKVGLGLDVQTYT